MTELQHARFQRTRALLNDDALRCRDRDSAESTEKYLAHYRMIWAAVLPDTEYRLESPCKLLFA